MNEYLELVEDILTNGKQSNNRTHIPTLRVSGRSLRFDMSGNTIPLVTTRELNIKALIGELVCFIQGKTNVQDFIDNDCPFWNINGRNSAWVHSQWIREPGDLGPIYGAQWRRWRMPDGVTELDQLAMAIETLVFSPESRRNIVTAWNPGVNHTMALPPCHTGFQLLGNIEDNSADMIVTIRSSDVFLGLPYNIASYALLFKVISKLSGVHCNELIFNLHDVHIYANHIEQCKEQLKRQPLPLAEVEFLDTVDVHEFKSDYAIEIGKVLDTISTNDFIIKGYKAHPKLTGQMAD
jgi:thymidylate synthase